MRVLAWVPQAFDTSPGQRFRIEQWQPHLAAAGVEVFYSPFADGQLTTILSQPGSQPAKVAGIARAVGRRLLEAVRNTKAQLVYIFREDGLLGPAFAAHLLSLRGIPFVFDFDDAVFIRYVSPSNGLLSYLRCPGKTATLCRQARHVLAGNPFLQTYAAKYNERVSVVPTTIDTQLYVPRAQRHRGELPVVGWTGSFSTAKYLELVWPALESLARRRRFLLRVVGAPAPTATTFPVESRSWTPKTEVEDIVSFDVGIMPLSDDPWAKGKCGLKALQYMALGVPPVVSPIGVNCEIVDHERNGLLATTQADWLEGLDRLLGDPALHGRMSREARQTVEERYSAAVVAPRVADILRGAVR